MESVWGVGVIFALLGVRVVVVWVTALAAAVREVLIERSHRTTLLAVAEAMPREGVLVDERSDGGKTIYAAGGVHR